MKHWARKRAVISAIPPGCSSRQYFSWRLAVLHKHGFDHFRFSLLNLCHLAYRDITSVHLEQFQTPFDNVCQTRRFMPKTKLLG